MFTLLLVLILVAGLFFWLFFLKRDTKLPPGPWGLPLAGNLLSLGDYPTKTFIKWKKQFGPVSLIQLGSFRTILLNDAASIKAAFSNPAFSSRPNLKLWKESTNGRGLLFSDFENNREQRQFVIRQLRDFGLLRPSVETKIHEEISDLIQLLSQKGTVSMYRVFNTPVVNSAWSCLMSDRFSPTDKNLHQLLDYVNTLTQIEGPMALLGIFMPWFGDLFPSLTGVKEGMQCRSNLTKFMEDMIKERDATRQENQPRDVTDAYLDKVGATSDPHSTFHPNNNYLPYTTADLILAAIETTSYTLEWMLLYLAKNPEVQKRLQAEITNVVSDTRFPSLSDRANMPYMEAITHEVLRISSVVSIGVAHFTFEETEFYGYKVPKDTMIMSNLHGIHHDPEVWESPDEFQPERFLDENGGFKKNENLLAFSTGRRVCLGENFARDQVFLFTTRIFQKFQVSFPGDEPPAEGKFGFTLQPYPYEVTFTERI